MIIDYFGSFVSAMYEIFSAMIGIELTQTDSIENSVIDNKIIIGAMILKGQNNRLITIETDFKSAGFIISNMTGITPDDLSDDELADGIQEIVNMVAGSAKNKLEEKGCGYYLTSTFAFKGKDAGFFIKQGIEKKSAYFKAGDASLSLNIYAM